MDLERRLADRDDPPTTATIDDAIADVNAALDPDDDTAHFT